MTWSDGAHAGVTATRALETILGGKANPQPDECMTREQMGLRIWGRPDPLHGDKPYAHIQHTIPPSEEGMDAYSCATESLAKAFLIVLRDAQPGEVQMTADSLWAAAKKRWPGLNDWLGGVTGFQVGWAVNVVRWLTDEPPVSNPALVEVET